MLHLNGLLSLSLLCASIFRSAAAQSVAAHSEWLSPPPARLGSRSAIAIAGASQRRCLDATLSSLVVILFFWAKSAALLNRPLPPLPNLEVSEEDVVKVADETRVCINRVLSMAHDIAVGGDLKLFWQKN